MPAVNAINQEASAAVPGVVELATSAEAITGMDTARAVTPKALADAVMAHVTAASATAQGKVELATNAEAITGTDTARAITAANLRAVFGKLKVISFDGKNGAGACTATGAVIGDLVLAVFGITGDALGAAGASFETAITVVDQIQQSSASNLSANDYVALLLAVA
jgi:hypothetical protein